MTTGVVVFDYTDWKGGFPALSGAVSSDMAQRLFMQATILLDNTPHSIVRDVGQRSALYGLLVAHLAVLEAGSVTVDQPKDATGAPIPGTSATITAGTVGQVTSAREGSVSVGVQALTSGSSAYGTEGWYNQTQFGATFWAMIQPFLRGAYDPGPDQSARWLIP